MAFRGDVILKDSPQAFQTINSREYGASCALLQLAKQLGLDKAPYSRNEVWLQDCLAMIVGRIVYAGSKLALSNQWKGTALWELCGVEGPVDVEGFAGNTQDASTVLAKVQELKRDYGLNKVTFVGDRGMVTQTNAEKLKEITGLHTISALIHRQILDLVERKLVQAELFDEKRIAEVVDPDKPGQRDAAGHRRLAPREAHPRSQLCRVAQVLGITA